MRRPLYICALSAALLGTTQGCTSRPADDGQLRPLPQAALQDAGAPADAGTTSIAAAPVAPAAAIEKIDDTLLEEARSLLPPPLLYGRFRPQVGTFVEYEVSSKKTKARVRASVVGRTVRATGEPMYQVEFNYPDTKPRTLVVAWIIGDERPFVERLAIAVDAQTPVSIPVDLYLDQPELRGSPSAEQREAPIKSGPFAGPASQRGYQLDAQTRAEVLTTDKVPLFGVHTVQGREDTWVARSTGTGATPELLTIPMMVPRFSAHIQ